MNLADIGEAIDRNQPEELVTVYLTCLIQGYSMSCPVDQNKSKLNEKWGKILAKYRRDFSDEFYNRKKMGFVFNLEDWVFKNFNLILKELEDGEISNHIDLRKIKYLNLWKSRINGLRVWKLYFLNRYLQSIKFL